MSDKKQYLIGYSRGAVMPKGLELLVDSLEAGSSEIVTIRKLASGQRVVSMDAETAVNLASKHPDLAIEEDRELQLFSSMPGLPPLVPTGKPVVVSFAVNDAQSGEPIPEATVFCVSGQFTYKGGTNRQGLAKVTIPELLPIRVIISPRDTHWSRILDEMPAKAGLKIQTSLQPIPLKGKYSWGHAAMGLPRIGDLFSGAGIKIAVIDSGIARHEDLKTVGGHNTLDGRFGSAWDKDEAGHGTHSGGIIAAASQRLGVRGVAPGAEIHSLKVCPDGRFSNLLEAINWCIDNYIDVIQMGLGSQYPSEQIDLALAEAAAHGITCVAAVGNDSGAVAYPASNPNVIAVSAIGRIGTFPDQSAHSLRITGRIGRDGKSFFAGFSNFGPEVTVCAPGVAIPATVPTGYAAWDGTSTAAAFVAGLAALILDAFPEIRTGDYKQPQYVLEIIKSSATDLGLPGELQGAGLINAERALGAALARRRQEIDFQSAGRKQLESLLDQARKCREEIKSAIAGLETF